jgi:multidrug resistance efflux pump
MKKKLIIIGVVIILVAVVIFVAVAKMRGRSEKKTDRIEVVRRGPFVVKLNERGNLEPLIKVDVRSNVEGEIEKLYVDEGYDVVKGQKLLKIDEKQIREEYNQSQANYNAAEAEMDRAMENITLSSGRLESNIQLGESTLKSAQANLEATKARAEQQLFQVRTSISDLEDLLEQDKITLKRAELALEQTRTSEKSAKARLENAKAELDRKEELHRKKFVSLQEVENARLAYSSAQSQYESAQNDVQAQEKDVQSREKSIESREMRIQAEKSDLENLKESLNKEEDQVEIQIQQAQERLDLLTKSEGSERQIAELAKTTAKASLLRAESMLNNAKERLDWTTLIAPMAGRVVQCDVEEGEIITSGRSAWSQGPAIMIIADLSKMIVKAYVHEFDIGKVKVGQRAEIEISAYPDDTFEGEVKEISPSGQPMDNIIKFEVMVMVTKAPKPLLPAMTADVDIIVDERDNVPQLPLEAVIPREAIQIKTDIKKEMLSKLRDQEVKIAISNYPDKTFDGKVTEIAPARPGFTTSEVTIIMKGSPKELQTGTSRTADIIISDDEKISNAQTRIETEKKYYVKLIKEETGEVTENPGDKEKKKDKGKEEKTEEEKMVKVGERTQSNIEILDGLKEGDKVKVVPVGGEKKKEE